jgi:hypothetical protein
MPTYIIPTANGDALLRSMVKLTKRALKLGMTPPTIVNDGTKILTIPVDQAGTKQDVEHTVYTINGEVPQIEGWEMLAAIEHIDGKNIISQLPLTTGTVPIEYRDAKPFCNHCNTHRVKIHSYIIRNKDNGETMQVGKTCMKDYFDKDISAYINWWKHLDLFFKDVEDGDYTGVSKNDIRYDFRTTLEASFACVRLDGYNKSDSPYPTKDDVLQHMTGFKRVGIIEEDVKSADAAIEWLKKQDPKSDFINNLQNFLELDKIPAWSFGYIAGIVPSYTKSQREQIEVLNEWVGREGVRSEMTLTLKKLFVTEGYYGTTYIHTFLDDQNRMFVWFASKDAGLEKNVPTLVKATVKGHEKFKGVKQTKINRLVVVK